MSSRLRPELLLLVLLCFGPFFAAWVLYFYGDPGELPRLANEERRLFEPAVALPPLPGRAADGEPVENLWAPQTWSLVYARESACGETCIEALTRMNQVWASLGRDTTRVRRVVLLPGDAGAAGGGPGAFAPLDGRGAAPLRERLDALDAAPGDGRIYVVDPHGNLVVSYPADAAQEGLRDDLKRLLNVSRIG